MNRFLALSMTAMLSIAVMVDLPVSANAQGFQQSPLTMAGIVDVAGVQDGVIEVRSRRRSSRRRRNNAVAGAIIGSAIIGAIIANQDRRRYRRTRRVYRGDAHEQWCYYRFRSYRAWDNTYQPYRGRRRQCISPYY